MNEHQQRLLKNLLEKKTKMLKMVEKIVENFPVFLQIFSILLNALQTFFRLSQSVSF